MNELIIKIKLSQGAIMPSYAHLGDAGLDLYSNAQILIKSNKIEVVPTGVFLKTIPNSYRIASKGVSK